MLETIRKIVIYVLGALTVLLWFKLNYASAADVTAVVTKEAAKYQLDPQLVLSVIEVESRFNPKAVGKAGEVGLMQLHPRWFPSASFNVNTNIKMGVHHLALMRITCPSKQVYTWVNCYNLGPRKVLKHPTKFRYYKKVMAVYQRRLLEIAKD